MLLKLLLIIIPAGLLLWYLIDEMWTGEYYVTSESTVQKVAAAIRANGKERGTLYDLGSGRGDFLIRLLLFCPELRGHGFEKSLLKVWLSRLRARMRGSRAQFSRADFMAMDISEADMIYAYLPRPLLPALTEKLKRELAPGAIALTSRVELSEWTAFQVVPNDPAHPGEERVFLYRNS